ncbi:HTH-type transcriptional activator RhaS [Methylorubrum aminovorans]|uniref:HTH-type transcriptional activator RhaS n=1 Tax=Methylorubrum aminovorans TaxID=269069 RepID=A0ABQ4ULM4_9HYPH|nr:HTH-type transcriptional activator RhaS [Methylorubrum aminovorans]
MPSCTPRSCTRASRHSHTPARAQRMKICAARHHGPNSSGLARHLAPFWCRYRMAESVRCRSCGGVIAFGRQACTSSSRAAHCASFSISPLHPEGGKRSHPQDIQTTTDPSSHSREGTALSSPAGATGTRAAPDCSARRALSQIRRAVDWIRDNPNARLRIGALCDATGMSRASLHRHFLAMTGLTPLQYQKQIRLIKARHLLLGGDHRASDVAFSVGYESASQFNRKYSLQFGAPPARDVRQIRQAITNPTSS